MTAQGKEHSAMKICKHAFCDRRRKRTMIPAIMELNPKGKEEHSGHSKLRAYQHGIQSCRMTMLDKHRVHGHQIQKKRLKKHV